MKAISVPSKRRATASDEPVASKITHDVLHQNVILSGLDAAQFERIVEEGVIVDLAVRDRIYEPEQTIEAVYFPLKCVLSVVTLMKNGGQIEIGTIGREGVSAIPLLLGATTTANEAYCQVPGTAVKIDVKIFASLKSSPTVRQLLDRYVQAYVNMLGQLAACNRLHNVYERCARWLLMTQDRVGLPEISLTHEYLAMMLGTQRSGVTIAVGTLRRAGFIAYGHGVISIVDRVGLENASCECYDVAREQFGGLLRTVDDTDPRANGDGPATAD